MIKLDLYLEKKIEDGTWERIATIALNRNPEYLEPFDANLKSMAEVALKQNAVTLLKNDITIEEIRGNCLWKDATLSEEAHGLIEVSVKREDLEGPRENYLGEMNSSKFQMGSSADGKGSSLYKAPQQTSTAAAGMPSPYGTQDIDDMYGGML